MATRSLRDLPLRPDALVRLSPTLRTRTDPMGHVVVDCPSGAVVDLGPRGYAVLSLLAGTQPLATVLDRIEAQLAPTDVAPCLGALNQLLEESALVLAAGHPGPTSGWADPVEHGRMLHDDRRTRAYLAAIAEAVQPGDVVLDIGTGSGVLAVAAVRAGARRVYAIEGSDIAALAQAVFEANGVADRVTLMPGWSRHLDLPEPADVLVSEIIGNEPFEEEILETTADARRRLLRAGARQVPERLTLLARPLLIPEDQARQRALGGSARERWQGLYGMDFGPLVAMASADPVLSPTEAEVAARWPPAGPAVPLVEVDLRRRDDLTVDSRSELVLDGGRLNAVAITFRAHLVDDVTHEMDPWRWPSSSWATSVWVLPEPLTVARGTAVVVRYARRAPDRADGVTVSVERRIVHGG